MKKYFNPERKKLLRQALTQAGKIILEQARQLCNSDSGTLKKSLILKVKYYPNKDRLVVMIGPRTWFVRMWKGRKLISHKYAHLAHSGRKALAFNRPVKFIYRGRMIVTSRVREYAGSKFIERSVRITKNKVINTIMFNIARGL